jgi:two-component sensor histidine kinase
LKKKSILILLIAVFTIIFVIDLLSTSKVAVTVLYFIPIIVATYSISIVFGTLFTLLSIASNILVLIIEKKVIDSYVVINSVLLFLVYLVIEYLIYVYKNKNDALAGEASDKELLIKDIYHRMKNQFSLLQSLLELTEDTKEVKSQIAAFSTLYDFLCYKDEKYNVDLVEYIKKLVEQIAKSSMTKKIEYSVSGYILNVDNRFALNIGLIVNELVTNSLKYSEVNPIIIITIYEKLNRIILRYEDNGINFSKNNFENSQGIGYLIIKSLTEQLKGKLNIASKSNADLEIDIPNMKRRTIAST